jgi:hypothetical protein
VLLSIGLACAIALHVLRPDLGFAGHRISEYANGPYGYVMTAAFVSIGAGMLALAAAVAQQRERRSRAVALAIAAAGLGMVAAGIWRTDADRVGVTTDAIHSRASAVATLVLIVAALAWSAVPLWRGPGRGIDLAAVLAVVAALFGAVSPALHRSSWTGVSQRLLWLSLLAWLILTAWQLRPRFAGAVTEA